MVIKRFDMMKMIKEVEQSSIAILDEFILLNGMFEAWNREFVAIANLNLVDYDSAEIEQLWAIADRGNRLCKLFEKFAVSKGLTGHFEAYKFAA